MVWKRPEGQREYLVDALWPRTCPRGFRDIRTPRCYAGACWAPPTPPRTGTGSCQDLRNTQHERHPAGAPPKLHLWSTEAFVPGLKK